MVKIRLMRVGKKKQPSFRVVVADSRSARDGRIIEAIGNYNPRIEPSGIDIDNDRAVHWLRVGAQPSEQVKKLLRISGAWSDFTGEAPPPTPSPEERKKKATPAASVAEEASPETAPEGEEPGVIPEAEDQAEAAPEAEVPEQEA